MNITELIGTLQNEHQRTEQYESDVKSICEGISFKEKVPMLDGNAVDPNAVKNLVFKLDGKPDTLKELVSLNPTTASHYMQDLGTRLDAPVYVQSYDNAVENFSNVEQQWNNGTMAEQLGKMLVEGKLSLNTEASPFYHNRNKTNFRLINREDWNFKNGYEYYGGVKISYDRFESQHLEVQPAIARVGCFNWTLSDNLVTLEDAISLEQASQIIDDGISHILRYSEEMFNLMQSLANVEIVDPKRVFDYLATKYKLPENIQDQIVLGWGLDENGGTLYDVVQAVVYGSQEYTRVSGRKRVAKWTERDTLETEIWRFGTDLHKYASEGYDVNALISNSELIRKTSAIAALERDDPKNSILALQPEGWS